MFSIILPLYNKAKWVISCIESILNQTYTEFELIIINDGSTDNSLQLVTETFSDERIIIIEQSNQGVSAARNKGIAGARFDYLAFIDADDVWHPQYLQLQLEAFEKYPHISICVSGYKRFRQDNELDFTFIQNKSEATPVKNYFKNAIRTLLFWTSATVVRKKVFATVATFNPGLKSGEDVDVWFRIMLHFEAARIPEVLAFYRRDTENVYLYQNVFGMPPIEEHLVAHMLDIYHPYLSDEKYRNKGVSEFVYQYILNSLLMFYFNPAYYQQSKSVLKKVPAKYRYSRLPYILFMLPYRLSLPVFRFLIKIKYRQS